MVNYAVNSNIFSKHYCHETINSEYATCKDFKRSNFVINFMKQF